MHGVHIDGAEALRHVRHSLLVFFKDVFLIHRDPKHDIKVSDHTFDLTLQLAFLSDVKKWHNEIAHAVVHVGVRQAGEYPRPFPVLLGSE